MPDFSFTVKSYTFPQCQYQSVTINDRNQAEGGGYQVNQGPNYLVNFSEQNGVFTNQGTTFAGGPPIINNKE